MSSLKVTELKVPVAPRKGIQDSLGFWIPGTEFRFLCQWDLDSGFQSLEGFRITWAVFQIPESRIRIPQPKFLIFRIPQAKISRIPEFEFPYTRRFLDFWFFNICSMMWSSVHLHVFLLTSTLLSKTFLLHCPQQVQLFSLDARKTEQKSKLHDRLGLRRGEIKSDKRRRWKFSGILTQIIDVVYKTSLENKLGPNSCKTRARANPVVADVLVGAIKPFHTNTLKLDPCLR